ncbi:hypothetical protein KVR01_008233 [Diaporthe batatas]|uniref:uncharacterized protein n=1 Tax=Diaporthe batatas TaxID=748121 RepID=UPI001D04AF34|nr:uncharacterized protein KVR01_008233 [Diaporthe batatas]KAG8162468.1 hypothetical protein KVR01_008233 [Diaporthe batatas]
MPQKTDHWRDRPLAGQSGSTAAAFAFAIESPEDAQPPPPSNEPSVNSGPNEPFTMPDASDQSPTIAKPASNNGIESPLVTTGTVQDELDQLESEVIHYMNISLEEKEKSDALTGRLESVTQEKKDLERQVDDLDEQLSRDVLLDQEDGASATEAGSTISRVSDKIAKLRSSAQALQKDFNDLNMISDRRADQIAELQEQLHNKKQQLVQKTQEEDRLRRELASAEETLKSEKKNYNKLLGSQKALELRSNGLRAWGDNINQKLAESEQTRETLSGLLNQKATELQNVRKGAAAHAQNLQQFLDHKQEEIKNLRAYQKDLLEQHTTERENTQQAGVVQIQKLQKLLLSKQEEVKSLKATQRDLVVRCEQAEAVALQYSQTISQLQAQLASQPEPQPVSPYQCEPAAQQQDLLRRIEDLTTALVRNQKRRMRVVGIGIDLSGSAAGSLEGGIKRVYAHLIDTLQSSPCQTYVMTVVHGPGSAATVTTTFADDWATHKRALEGRRADGVGRDVECLRKIKEAAVEAGAVLDLQVVLIGDNDTNYAAHEGMQEVCADFARSNPPVHIHSVVVSTGTATMSENFGLKLSPEAWTPWDYVTATGGNRVLWFQNNELPDLSDLVH